MRIQPSPPMPQPHHTTRQVPKT
ncbi:hypothetical protein SVAN01_03248 [Stagonosporopsis vannaccii]|nr:hypothetical protein SVAN01_03248 [Stagonosporopsis vannaccii]